MNYRIISADDHIDLQWLPKDLWQKRVSASWRARAPKVVETPEGPYWVCGDDRWDSWGGRRGAAGAQGGRRTALERGGVLEPGVLRPTTTELRLEDMDRDGIDATVMYGPIVPPLVPDPELRRVSYRAYNEWLAEFCAGAPDRLVGAGLIPIDDPKTAADEVRYLEQIGLRTGMFLAARVELPLWDEAWEPLWEAAAETGLPIVCHRRGGLRPVAFSGRRATQAGNMGVRLPARRQHVARVGAGDRGEFQERRRRGAPAHPVRQRAGTLRALTAPPSAARGSRARPAGAVDPDRAPGRRPRPAPRASSPRGS